jgi:hypothetical protein
VDQLYNAIIAALVIAVPVTIAALFALVQQWLRVRRAKLRAQRLELPPSTEPPPPAEPWYSLRPRKHRRKK